RSRGGPAMKLKIIAINHHRNGISGAPFDVVLFDDQGPEGSRKVAIVFDQEYHCAVLDVAKLAAGDIAFASNSWRGDAFEQSLRKAIRFHAKKQDPTVTLYNVHLYREMRLKFERIEADTPEAAAAIARDKLTTDADNIDDCEGETFSALVDVIGDDE